jgi:hypothetical protein
MESIKYCPFCGHDVSGYLQGTTKVKRTVSKETREKIRKAQQKRWNKSKSPKTPTT